MIKRVGETIIRDKHRATCHCGSVELELSLPDGIVDPRRCDCSICRRKGAIVASVPLAGIRVVKGDGVLKLYQFNTQTAKHYFCSICGIYTHHQRRSNPAEYGYNVGCLEGVNPFDLGAIPTNDGVNHPADTSRIFLRALLAFLALPGVVAFLVPVLIGSRGELRLGVAGLGFFAPGLVVLLWCVVEFYVSGKGTLALWAPPQKLVRGGPYRVCRNPMYVGVLLILVGWAFLFHSVTLGWYSLAVAIACHLRVIFGEEPWLARTYGAEWKEYIDSVPRWLVRIP